MANHIKIDIESLSTSSDENSGFNIFDNNSSPENNNSPGSTITDKSKSVEEQRKENTTRGLSGLQNIGNTCYMNSILQCLAHIQLFRSYVCNRQYRDRLYRNKKKKLAEAERKKQKLDEHAKVTLLKKNIETACSNTIVTTLARTLDAMWKSNVKVVPRSFKSIIGSKCSMFQGYDQNDSQELLIFVLDQIHEETKSQVNIEFVDVPEGVSKMQGKRIECAKKLRDEKLTDEQKLLIKKEYLDYKDANKDDATIYESYIYWKRYLKNNQHSIITDLFTGLFYSKIICDTCGTSSDVFEPFTMLSIQTKDSGKTTLDECLEDFCSNEKLSGINQYSCAKCKVKRDATKKLTIYEPPEILIIHLKRFKREYVAGRPRVSKTYSTVEFPLESLSLDKCYTDIHKKEGYSYDLVAVSEHSGSTSFGHYIAHCKNAINNKWYEFNDSSVFHVPNKDVEKELVSKNAYILFYVRRNN